MNADTDALIRNTLPCYTQRQREEFNQKREVAEVAWKCHKCFSWHPNKQEYVGCERLVFNKFIYTHYFIKIKEEELLGLTIPSFVSGVNCGFIWHAST